MKPRISWRMAPWVLLAILAPPAILALLAFGLSRDPSVLPSATVGRQAPAFELSSLEGGQNVRLQDFRGQVVVVNFWASWCVSCRIEHDVLVELGHLAAGRDDLAAVGVNYRDSTDAAHSFLARYGAYPYPSGVDANGRTGIDFGVYGLPETYFIDPDGRIAARHLGPIDAAALAGYLADLGVQL